MFRSAGIVPARTLGVLSAALLLVLAVAGPAAAHASLTASEPQAGTTLATPPAQVTLTFNEAIDPNFAQVQVTSPDGTRVDAGVPAVDGTTVTVPLQPLAAGGVHTVAFRVVSTDNHPVEASFTFDLAPPPAPSPSPAPEPTASESASPEVPTEPSEDTEVVAEPGTAPPLDQDPSSTGAQEPASTTLPLPQILAGVAVVTLLGMGVYGLARRRGTVPDAS